VIYNKFEFFSPGLGNEKRDDEEVNLPCLFLEELEGNCCYITTPNCDMFAKLLCMSRFDFRFSYFQLLENIHPRENARSLELIIFHQSCTLEILILYLKLQILTKKYKKYRINHYKIRGKLLHLSLEAARCSSSANQAWSNKTKESWNQSF